MNDEEPVHWELARHDWDGEYYELAVRHDIQHPVSSWLDPWLGDRLERLAGMQGVRVRVSAAQWNENGVGDWGEVVFEGIRRRARPRAPARAGRAAVREASATADIAAGEIKEFDENLRGETAAD
jgi:hypothetical protein